MLPKFLKRFISSLYVIVGVVFIWRGAWIILDLIDEKFFGGNNVLFAVFAIAAGIILLELHDHRYDKMDHF